MEWHERYLQQAGWTRQLRAYLFQRVGLQPDQRVLEVGCGTGAVLLDFPRKEAVHGLDISLPALAQTRLHVPQAILSCADAASLPYNGNSFDLVFCHYLLLWMRDPRQAISEMRRVTRPGGAVLALAEPDYGGRLDFPVELTEVGRWQADALREQGADPALGRKLAGLFNRAGLRQVETGVLGGEWQTHQPAGGQDLEWQVLADDLNGRVSAQAVAKMKMLDDKARAQGERVLYVPTFYAWGLA